MSGQGNGRGARASRSADRGTNGHGTSDLVTGNGRTHPGRLGRGTPGLVIGRILSVAGDGTCTVGYDVGPDHFAACALTTIALTEQDAGRAVTVAFADDDSNRPIVTGLLRGNLAFLDPREDAGHPSWKVEAQGKRIVVSAADEFVLRCGKSSVTLTRTGKVVIRGVYLLSRASGVNRIKGASVQIN